VSPHLAWAALVAVLLATNCATHARLESAQTKVSAQNQLTKKQKEEASLLLQLERERIETLQRALKIAAQMQEKQDAKNTETTLAEAVRLRDAAVPSGRLRDPHADSRTCGGGGGGAPEKTGAHQPEGAAGQAEAGGLLSAPLTNLLRTTQLEADTINDAYASCRAQALSDRGLPPEPPDTEE